ncbi:MAG: galactokinase [Actinomycetota bacterium]
MNLTAKAQAGFHASFGYAPSGVWSAPGRANLIGEHTDYNNGFVLPFGINFRTYAALSLRSDRSCRVVSEIDSKVYEISLDDAKPIDLDWALYPLGVAWVMREYATAGFDCYITSDVPIGAGLSSSAAIESAMAIALNQLWGANLERKQLALIGQQAENQVVGAPTGIMDQTASMMAQNDAAVLIDCQDLTITVVDLGLSQHDLVVAVIDTQVSHSHAHGGYGSRRTSCEVGAKQLGVASLRELSLSDLPRAQSQLDDETFRRVRHVITENQRVLDTLSALREGNLAALGRLLLESHASMRDDFEISVAELDLAVETALATGAIGARMTGGGFGGAAIAIIHKDKLSELETNCLAAFAKTGFKTPRVFSVTPSEGAKREF